MVGDGAKEKILRILSFVPLVSLPYTKARTDPELKIIERRDEIRRGAIACL